MGRPAVTHPVAEARSLQEAHKGDWSSAVKWAIAETLWATGRFHADDLLNLNLPGTDRNVIGAQIGGALARRWMIESGVRRRSANPSRHGAKSCVYEITDLGRERLAGMFTRRREDSTVGVNSSPRDRAVSSPSGEREGDVDETVTPTPLFDMPPDSPGFYDRRVA